MEALSKKWAAAREKLAASLEERMHAFGKETRALRRRRRGPPARREKMAAEAQKLREQWHVAREKMETSLSSNLKSSREEFDYLKRRAADSGEQARAKMAPHLEHLKSEFRKDRDKLVAFLKDDLKRTQEDMEKLRNATSKAAATAREKLSKKSHELAARIKALTEESTDESK